jgi:hypothetical protein
MAEWRRERNIVTARRVTPMPRVVLPLIAFVAFTAYTVFVAVNHNILGFLADHEKGGWSLQIFIDLVVAASSFWIVAVPDARARGITVWPYVVATPFLGSVAILAYFVHRSLRARS